jgi:hypothetical protein
MTQSIDPKHPIDVAKASWDEAIAIHEASKKPTKWFVNLLKTLRSYQGKEIRQGSVFLEFGATKLTSAMLIDTMENGYPDRIILEMTFLHRIDSVFLQATIMQSELYQLRQKGTISSYRTNLVSGGVLWTISEKEASDTGKSSLPSES